MSVASRRCILTAGLGLGALIMSACGRDDRAPTVSEPTPTGIAATASPVVAPTATAVPTAVAAASLPLSRLSLWTPHSPNYCVHWQAVARGYEARRPDVEVSEVLCGTGDQSY